MFFKKIALEKFLYADSLILEAVLHLYPSHNITRARDFHEGCNPFNQNSNRSDREKWSTSNGGPVFSKLFRLDWTVPLSFGPKFPEILVEWIAPEFLTYVVYTMVAHPYHSVLPHEMYVIFRFQMKFHF